MDATAEFFAKLNDPSRWVIKTGVPVFKPHVRKDPATGQTINVDVQKLYRIASNLQRMERQGGVPIRITLGHTEPGKPETEQPPIAGYYRNARVASFGPSGEPAIVVDEWLDPTYHKDRKNYPYRSAEYYDDTEQVTGVALLTRDPFLDLGVVAYGCVTAPARAPVLYNAHGQPRLGYNLVTGDAAMFPQVPPNPHGVYTGAVPPPAPSAAPVFPQPAPVPYAAPQYVAPAPPTATVPQYVQAPMPGPVYVQGPQIPTGPVQYAAAPNGTPPAQYNQWPVSGSDYRPSQTIPHSHTNTGAVYGHEGGSTGHAPPPHHGGHPGMGNPHGSPPGGGNPHGGGQPGMGDGDESGLHALHHHLGQAVQHLSRYLTGRRANRYADPAAGGPPPGPFPAPGGAPGAPPPMPGAGTADSPYARYANPAAPVRTISGLPIQYQAHVDQLQGQLRQQGEALRILYYERDQADTQACAAEISRLAALGYAVDESEVHALKATPPEHRPAFLQRIMSKYQRVGTDALPPILGDPTPGPAPDANRPISRDEMDKALSMTANDPDPGAFGRALQYIRGGGNPVQYGAPNAAPPPVLNYDPNGAYEPSANGTY